MTDQPAAKPNPKRFETSSLTLWIDWGMTWFIRSGGVAVIIAVFGIFVFIAAQVFPLFISADVDPLKTISVPKEIAPQQIRGLISDEWGELPAVLSAKSLTFLPQDNSAPRTVGLDLGDGPASEVTASHMDHRGQRIFLGTADGRFAIRRLSFIPEFKPTGERTIVGELKSELTVPLGTPGKPLRAIGFGERDNHQLAAAIQDVDGKLTVVAVPFTVKKGLIGPPKVIAEAPIDLTSKIVGKPQRLLVDERGGSVVVANDTGTVFYFFNGPDGLELRQTFRPFEDQQPSTIASLDYLLGDVSLVATNPAGVNRLFSLYIKPGSEVREFGHTKDFAKLDAGAETFSPSVRNKCFLLTVGKEASLRHGTSTTTRWEDHLEFPISHSAISGKYHRIFLLDDQGTLHSYNLDDPHPEAGMTALFGKVWYEGADAPNYVYQSSGTDDSEAKLSMVPLLLGSLKGTLYAMLFALPIAILGALYTAEFMHPRFKSIIKPVVEIMASLPSVVLGFMAAIWLAPHIEEKVPSILMVGLMVPACALLFGYFWSMASPSVRSHIRPGYEYLYYLPILVVSILVAWSLGPVLESMLFTYNGQGDFRQWWRNSTGLPFEQRNSLVVGVMMGFAVIPIIFTIAEDAMSNVPPALRSASLALGASRWQTAMRVVLPTASAGIFSAIMIGFGRAIGETMIVVMATGNTAIMSMNIFDGMRTLSANIAVELPEAAVHSTLFRTLFLGALLLFLLTFLINTAAELLRQHLREKYKTV
jgi:phosphate transport system permease protein